MRFNTFNRRPRLNSVESERCTNFFLTVFENCGF